MTWPTKDDFVDGDVLTAAQVNNIADNLNLYDPTSATSGQVPVADGAGSVSFATPAGGATEIMVPTAVVVGSGSATINANGSVSFSSVGTSLAIEGVFTSAHENYMIILTVSPGTSATTIQWRLRAGSTNTSTSDWKRQYIQVNNATVTAGGAGVATAEVISVPANIGDRNAATMFVYAPEQATYTKFRTFAVGRATTDYQFFDAGGIWNATTQFDGLAFTNIVDVISGDLTVYGFKD